MCDCDNVSVHALIILLKKKLLIVPMRFKYYRKKKKTNILELSLRCVAHASL